MECERFRARLRKENFVNPTIDLRTACKSLGEEYELSAQLINFTNLAKEARQKYIIEVFHDNNSASLFRSISITKQEAAKQMSDANMTNAEILHKIEVLLEQAGDSIKKKYRGLKSKRRNELLAVLEEVRSLFNSENEHDNVDYAKNSESVGNDVTREE